MYAQCALCAKKAEYSVFLSIILQSDGKNDVGTNVQISVCESHSRKIPVQIEKTVKKVEPQSLIILP